MRKWICFMILVTGMLLLTACGTREDSDDFMSQTDMESTGIVATMSENIDNNDKITESESQMEAETKEQLLQDEVTEMKVEVNGYTFHAALGNNDAVTELVEMMREQPVVINMSDYFGFEKVGSLGTMLPSSNSYTTTKAGDIVLYNSNQIVVFYGSNSWSYTRIGHITDLTGWQEALGAGDVTITFSID